MYLAIVDKTPDGRIAIYQDFDSEAEAQAHVAKVKARFPAAFVAEQPKEGNFADWRVGPDSAVIHAPAPIPPPESQGSVAVARIQADEVLRRMIRVLARRLNVTPQQLIDEIRAES